MTETMVLNPEEVLQINAAVLAGLLQDSSAKAAIQKRSIEARASVIPFIETIGKVYSAWESSQEPIQLVSTFAKPITGAYAFVIPTTATIVFAEKTDFQKRFREQAHKWARETQHLSSPTQMMLHPSYQAILGMAAEDKWEIIRLLILDLRQSRNRWFWALSYLTQENPIQPSDAGKMDRMITAWVNWARAKHII